MRLPRGRLLRSRVVSSSGDALAAVLDQSLTGYVVFEPQDTLLLDADGRGVLTFRDGVPMLAYHTGTDRGGVDGLADLALSGPYHVDVYAVSRTALRDLHGTRELRVDPGMPAERVAGDPGLADRTRARARSSGIALSQDSEDGGTGPADAVTSFLEDEAKIDAIKEQARLDAQQRASEWGLESELADDKTGY